MNNPKTFAKEHLNPGGARLKLVIALAIIAVVAYVGYNYIPVAIDAYYFKDAMQNKVNLAAAQGYDASWVSNQLSKGKAEFHVPDDAADHAGPERWPYGSARAIHQTNFISRIHVQLQLRLHRAKHELSHR